MKFKTKAGKPIEEIVAELNTELSKHGCVYRYSLHSLSVQNTDDWLIERVPANSAFLDSAILNASESGIILVNRQFRMYGIVLSWNNTDNIAWCLTDLSYGGE